ncbi:hypothetical protein F511_24310 [Dorcoceras hygrometricum]|uniref:Uncharacterized protein n=1 Tax=Dorcoceras hygrometricum TaxID=472368 RepID=A0A2Z7CTI2_9LAMI|nr:hypothetical protein F511_24310 [Dorcoceras hygrometricum]
MISEHQAQISYTRISAKLHLKLDFKKKNSRDPPSCIHRVDIARILRHATDVNYHAMRTSLGPCPHVVADVVGSSCISRVLVATDFVGSSRISRSHVAVYVGGRRASPACTLLRTLHDRRVHCPQHHACSTYATAWAPSQRPRRGGAVAAILPPKVLPKP